MDKFPSAQEIIEEAKRIKPKADINQLHALTFDLMIKYRGVYYKDKVKDFLTRPPIASLPKEIKSKISYELLKPVKGEIKYIVILWKKRLVELVKFSKLFQEI